MTPTFVKWLYCDSVCEGNVVNVPMSDGFCVSVFSIESMFAATTLCGLGHVQKFLHVSCD